MQNSATFAYSPLTHPNSIRILVLQPSPEPASILAGTLVQATLSELDIDLIRVYTALIYVSTSNEKSGHLCLGGAHVNITTDLEGALRHMRHDSLPHCIWVKQLCVNQADEMERASHAAIMDQIYHVARRTVIYCGSLSPSCEAVFKAVRYLLVSQVDPLLY